ncbi:MAG: hypothetical protein RPR28_10015 [Cycloclasticus sp.]|jgi:hypothetical protein
MDKLTELSGVAVTLKNYQTSKVKKHNKGVKNKSRLEKDRKLTLEYCIALLVGTLDVHNAKEEEMVSLFVKGALVWEFGSNIESDASYPRLQDKIVSDIEANSGLKQQVIKIIKELT